MRFSPDGRFLAVGNRENALIVYDIARNFQKLRWGISPDVYFERLSPPFDAIVIYAHHLLCGTHCICDDDVGQMWRVFLQEGVVYTVRICREHSSAITQLDWSADGRAIMTNSLDHEVLIWQIVAGPQVQLAVDQSQRDRDWDSWSVLLGFPVMGIWSDGMDGTDINAVHRSNAQAHVVAAGDDGRVRLLNYPSVIDKAPHHALR